MRVRNSHGALLRIARILLGASCVVLSLPAGADPLKDYTKSKNFDDLTPAEHTAAKAEARNRKLKVLRVCADPGNMPQSNSKGEGYQNKIIKLLAEDLGGEVDFFWRPYLERGLTRETFQNNECDVLLDMPYALQVLLTTEPVYRTTYVFAYRNDKGIEIKSFDDPILKTLKIGVYQHSGLREALQRRGHKDLDLHIISHDADLSPEKQPWRQVQKVIDGELDVAGVWGPFAGWLKTMKNEPIVLQPVNLWEDNVPMEFDLAIGMRQNDVLLKYMLDWALTRKKDEIAAILRDYGVPLVKCSRCAVEGDLPSHGTYFQRLRNVSQDRFLKDAPQLRLSDKASGDQVVSTARVESWLAEGADLTQELANAVLADDAERVTLLIGKGASVNKRDLQGQPAIHGAARNRNSRLIALLAESSADVNARDSDGFTPLLHAINRNHVPSIEVLAKNGADLEFATAGGINPLTWAIGDSKFYAAKALIEAGAKVDTPSGAEGVTPLMTAATQLMPKTRAGFIAAGPTPVEIATLLLAKGANVNAVSKAGVTALMVAAGHDNGPMIGLLTRAGADAGLRSAAGKTAMDIAIAADHTAAIGALKVLARSAAEPGSAPAQH